MMFFYFNFRLSKMKYFLEKIYLEYPKCFNCGECANHHNKHDGWTCNNCATEPYQNCSITNLTKLIKEIPHISDDSELTSTTEYLNDK